MGPLDAYQVPAFQSLFGEWQRLLADEHIRFLTCNQNDVEHKIKHLTVEQLQCDHSLIQFN